MTKHTSTSGKLTKLLGEAKRLAREYRELTGRPLGVTGEVAEYEAARLLEGVELSAVRQSGYDAVRKTRKGTERLQIKGRCILPGSKPGQRIGGIDLTKEWDVALLVLLDEHFEATAIYEADRAQVIAALSVPGSKARNERGQLGLSKFKAIGQLVWPSVPPAAARVLPGPGPSTIT